MRFLCLRHCPKICVWPLLFFVLFSSSSTSLLITIKTYYQTLIYTPLYIMGVLLLSCLLCNFQSTQHHFISCRLSATPSDASAGGTVGPIVQSTAAFPASRHPLTVSIHLFSLSTLQRLNIKCRAPHTGAEQSGNSIDDQQQRLDIQQPLFSLSIRCADAVYYKEPAYILQYISSVQSQAVITSPSVTPQQRSRLKLNDLAAASFVPNGRRFNHAGVYQPENIRSTVTSLAQTHYTRGEGAA